MLLGIQSDQLIQADRVERVPGTLVQRRACQPHVAASMRVTFGPIGMIQTTKKTHLAAERFQWLGGLVEFKLVTFRFRKPTPIIDLIVWLRQRHSVGRVDRAESPWQLIDYFGTHRLQNRQRK